ncbi:hypothetical protein ACFLTZ_01585 [Chloroflexota bacterium]
MIKYFALLALIFTLSLATPALADVPNSGKIEGQIVNGTADGSDVAGQAITLKIEANSNQVGSNTGKTDAEGHFTFDALSTDPTYSYQVSLTYQKVEYMSEWLNFSEGETTKSVELTVYDSTTSDQAIKTVMSHAIVYVEPDSLLVKEYFLLVNEADLTFYRETGGGNSGTLSFPMPKDATDRQLTIGLMDYGIADTAGGFADTMAVLPGMKEVAYSYKVSLNSATYTLRRAVYYPTASFDFLVQGENTEVTSNQLTMAEPLDIKGVQFSHFTSQAFVPGDVLTITLSGLSKVGNGNSSMAIWAVLALVVLVCGFVALKLIKKKKLQLVGAEDTSNQKKQRLLSELAQLDDDFEAQSIPEATYRQQRALKKAELLELMQSLEEENTNK